MIDIGMDWSRRKPHLLEGIGRKIPDEDGRGGFPAARDGRESGDRYVEGSSRDEDDAAREKIRDAGGRHCDTRRRDDRERGGSESGEGHGNRGGRGNSPERSQYGHDHDIDGRYRHRSRSRSRDRSGDRRSRSRSKSRDRKSKRKSDFDMAPPGASVVSYTHMSSHCPILAPVTHTSTEDPDLTTHGQKALSVSEFSVVEQMEGTVKDESFEWGNLREEIQERILARLPFVEVFHVPLLSKAWRKSSRTQAFLDEVTSVSDRWPIFCPVYLSRKGLVGYDAAAQRWQKLFTLSYMPYVPHGDDVVNLCSGAGSLICFARRNPTKEKDLFREKQKSSPVSYDLYSRLLALGSIERGTPGAHRHRPGRPPPEGFQTRLQDFQRRLQQFCKAEAVNYEAPGEAQEFNAYIEASLGQRHNLGVGKAFDIYVTNVVTKKCRTLPSRPCMDRPDIVQLVAVGTSAYKVILMTLVQQESFDASGPFCVQIYDSKADSWTSRNSSTISSLSMNCIKTCVYLERKGIFCIIVQDSDQRRNLYEILAYNVEHDWWTRIPHPVAFSNHEFLICELVTCGSDVMLITGRREDIDLSLVAVGYTGREKMLIYSFDVELMSFVVFSREPPPGVFKGIIVDLMVGAGDCVYFGLRSEPKKPLLAFNIHQKLWSSVPPVDESWLCLVSRMTKFPFQPGLNPYLDVGTERRVPAPDAGELARSAPNTVEPVNPRYLTSMEDVD